MDTNPPDHATAFFPPAERTHITQVAQALAAHGGGEVSVDLAFDLVLNEVVEQARNASGATGAAIALFRDGELVCRATWGENSPDLGVRVETGSSLAGSCVSTGEMQQCRDTETDPRVNAESCQRLGVRSMLIAPLVDSEKVFGILQVFSSWPNAFGKREISALQVLAGRIAETNREAQAGRSLATADGVQTIAGTPGIQDRSEPMEGAESSLDEEPRRKGTEIWSSILVLLIIAAAVALGVMVGWRGGAKGAVGASQSKAAVSTVQTVAPNPDAAADSRTPAATESAEPSPAIPAAKPVSTVAADAPPGGGLLVTENGKVIYRSPTQPGSSPATAQRSATRLIHRVEPDYPAQARAQHIQGSVVLDVQVLSTGAVGNIAVISGDPLLADAALLAVKQWRYQPNFVGGQAIESQARITIKFTLPSS